MDQTDQLSKEVLKPIISAIKSFDASQKLKEEELEELAKKAFLLQKTSNKEWLVFELENFHENKKKEQQKEEVKLIKPSKPVVVKSQEDLDQVVSRHEFWIDSILSPQKSEEGVRANLSSANLAGLKVENKNLSCASCNQTSFIGAKLVGLNFSRASLVGANMQGALIKNCNFNKTNLTETDFREADIVDCEFDDTQKKGAIGLL